MEKVNPLAMKFDHPERENKCPALDVAKQQPNVRYSFLPWAFCPPSFSYGLFAGFPRSKLQLFCSSRHGRFSCGGLSPHQWTL